ncbi:MAG: Ig-like domain-containing protein [Bacteroidales bacterium]|nr:Ig-like domain-containing protein [Bacteroidales bacterium]
MNSRIFSILIAVLASLLVLACAKQVVLTGGAKDVTPPEPKASMPENGSTNFSTKHKSKYVVVKFNEYIKLNDVSSKLIVSPPMEEKPVAIVNGKKLKIKIKTSQLKPNTTYCLNFNDAIADINENNALNSFVYAFSTGQEIDSLSFAGTVFDAFTRKPVNDAWVTLYSNLSDTAVSTTMPDYITKVDKNGNFCINFIAENDYKAFALRDNNSNFKFDLPEEGIAFIDTTFHPSVEISYDTVKTKDTLNDSIVTKLQYQPDDVKLLLFTENKTPQYFKSTKRVKRNYFELVFNFTQYEKFNFTVPNDSAAFVWAAENPDTIRIWLKDTALIASDTLKIFAEYVDPAFPDSIHHDTLKFRKQDKLFPDTLLTMKLSKDKRPDSDYIISFSQPVETFDTSRLSLFGAVDTLFEKMECSIEKDSLNPLNLRVIADIAEGRKYRVAVDSAFATCIYGYSNKADSIEIVPMRETDFGALTVKFQDDRPYLVELLQSDKIKARNKVTDRQVTFVNLLPGKYDIRIIDDENGNGRWDTGDYTIHLQPEKIFYYPQTYEIRSSWEHEVIIEGEKVE